MELFEEMLIIQIVLVTIVALMLFVISNHSNQSNCFEILIKAILIVLKAVLDTENV